jgi:LemA protein
MPAMLTAGLVLVSALLVWVAVAFNLLIRDRNRVKQGWADVDVQLLRRSDLIPRLTDVVKGYAGYESALLSSLAELRTQGATEKHPGARGEVEKSLGNGVHKLVALVEAYPDLKASQNFLELQKQLADTENQIQYARRYYNGAVNAFNNRIQRFPDLVVANGFGFQAAEFFQAEPGQAAAPGVKL